MSNIFKKTLYLILLISLSPIIGGLYGILHDQITVTISPEYYTKFKFLQFGISDLYNGTESSRRILACNVGWLATWWMGPPITIVLGLVALIIKDANTMLRIAFKSIITTMLIALITGFIGLGFGYFVVIKKPMKESKRYNIETIENKDQFRMVGSMHNFSYLGGLIGMIGGITLIIRKRKTTYNTM